jgi:hypothetical protein
MNINNDTLVAILQSAQVLSPGLYAPDSPSTTAFLCGKQALALELLNALDDEQKHQILMRLLCPKEQ